MPRKVRPPKPSNAPNFSKEKTPLQGQAILKAKANGWETDTWDDYTGGYIIIGFPFEMELLLGDRKFAEAVFGKSWREMQMKMLERVQDGKSPWTVVSPFV